MKVVAYAHACLQQWEVNLCAECAADPKKHEFFGTLGAVQCGAHEGTCEGCEL